VTHPAQLYLKSPKTTGSAFKLDKGGALILAQHIDLLAGAIATDNRLASYILQDPLRAIQEYNADFAERYHQPAIELTEEERHLVLALPQKAHNILEVYECLAAALEKQKAATPDIATNTSRESDTSAA